MSLRAPRFAADIAVAFQFLTRLPVPQVPFAPDGLARAVKFFPLVGLVIGAGAALLQKVLSPHLSRPAAALVVLAYLVLITGCLHEDGLADASDGLGGGWNPQQILTIMRDSRIGSYGAIALVMSLLLRWLLLARVPAAAFLPTVVSAHVLCRWSTLPLSYFLPPARPAEGQGARVAQLVTRKGLLTGTALALVIVGAALRLLAWKAILAATVVTLSSGWYYRRRIGGVTGDCFGATNQLTEIAVYFTALLHR